MSHGSVTGIRRCDVPSISETWTNVSTVSKVNKDFWKLMDSTSWVHAPLFASAFNSSVSGCGFFSLLVSQWLLARSLSGWFWLKFSDSTFSCSSVLFSVSTTGSSSRLILWARSVLNLESASSTWCLTPARWNTLKSSQSIGNSHLANFPERLADVSNHFNVSGFMYVVKQSSLRYACSNNTAHTTTRH